MKYATFFGGGGHDNIQSVKFLPGINGFAIAGYTTSTDLPVSTDAYLFDYQGGEYDGFVTRFSEEGELIWSTYFGGDEMDYIWDMEVDAFGSVYIAGRTYSANLATSGVYQTDYKSNDAFLAKFDSTGALMWCTYFGDVGDEYFNAVAISPDGTSVYCAGYANSDQNIAHNGWQNTYGGTGDALLTNFNSADGTLNWSTYYGGAENDEASAVVVASDGDIYIGGRTHSDANIASAGVHKENLTGNSDIFIVRFSPEGNREWATYYGGDHAENLRMSFTLLDDHLVMQGKTWSDDNIVFGNPFDPGGPYTTTFVSKFNLTGQVLWGTFFLSDRPVQIDAIKTIPGSSNIVAFGTVSEITSMTDFITPDAYQSYNAGEVDLFFFVFEDNTVSAKTHTLNPLKVYPNPATDMVTIERPENLTGNFNLEVFDMMGKLISRKSINSWNAGMDVSKLITGTYILKINTDKEIYRAKIIVE